MAIMTRKEFRDALNALLFRVYTPSPVSRESADVAAIRMRRDLRDWGAPRRGKS